MKVYIIGVGLIGGSMALDIKKIYSEVTIFGIDANEEFLEKALELNLIHQKATIETISEADFVILAIPVDVALVILPKILDVVTEKTLVLDVGSTKFPICEVVENHLNRRNFMATHPIAGTEFSGPTAAIENLFQDKTNIICEVEKTAFKLQEKGLELFKKLGMRIRYMEAKSHDKHIAYVSHLSHISSFMLGKTVIEKEKDERDIFDMAGSGFESTVRLAKSSPAMWTPIFNQNKKHVVNSLEEYILNLTKFKEYIENNDLESVFNEMKNTNRIKEILK
ncbi:prephenate dehydrogenase [Flavobacterium capsici]|uniref:Prephenate dehydrogenase n=1 Tax=Flavobacterium capsici TaxID=3075618 RepID=A0AA96J7K1_9FLAO|nr:MULTISPECIES: prephenate dehydrogenase [unclassified Flavobacterium]WNM20032.1 prephenate dehydrogenase [Flavobacterium sp. PMR2A8]WNM21421.1 prephenate dehydrogenase [Flavobacterium sp. PMTSA4]